LTVLLWTLAAGCTLPYICSSLQTIAKLQNGVRYNNRAPREQTAALEGWGKRASWAQANSWEALTIFAIAALICHVAGGDGAAAGYLGIAWVGFRIAYIAAYAADFAYLRSTCWTLAVVCAAGLAGLAAWH
jgi:uncharacterized MAPEG superfamily protein